MAHDSEWMASLKIKAEAEMSSVDRSIKEIQAKLDKAKVTYKNRLDTFGNNPDDEYIQKSLKEIEKYEKQLNAAQTRRTKLEQNYKMQVLQNEREITRQIEAEENKRAKAAFDRKKQLLELQKQNKEIINSDTATKEQKAQARKNYTNNKDEIRLADGDIKTYGSEELQKQNAMLNQRNQLEKISVENEKRRQQAYNESLELASREFQIKKQIQTLESKKDLNDADKEKLQTLQNELGKVQELKQNNKELISGDQARVQALQNVENKYENMLQSSKRVSAELDKQNSKTKSLGKNLGDGINNIFKYMLAYKAIGLVESGMQNAIDTIKELDKAFTDIQLVTQSTNEEIQNLQVSYNQLAKEMSATTQEVAEGATEWLRQGYSLNETEDLLKSSMTLSKVGAIESAQATQLLTSSLNGFKIEAEDAMSVVDKVSAVDLAAATSSEELMTAMARTASSAQMAGVSIDKLIGMIATVSSVTRKSASTIGESFKTIFARLQNVKAGKSVDDMGESVNDVEKVLNRLGISLRESSGQWRDMEDVIDEVASKFKNYTEVEQAQIATAIAGTRQRDNFLALISNYQTALDLTTTSLESAGTATQKMEIWQEGLEAKTNELKAAWEGFLISLKQSDSLKDLMDIGIWALNNLPSIIGYVTSLFIAFKGAAIITSVLKALGNLRLQMKLLSMEVQTAGGGFKGFLNVIGGSVSPIGLATAGISLLVAEFSFLIQKQKEHEQEIENSIQEMTNNINKIDSEKKSLDDLIQKYKEAHDSTKSLATKKEEYKSIQEKINETYQSEADGLDLVNGKYDEQIAKLEELQKKKDTERYQEYSKNNDAMEEKLFTQTTNVLSDEELANTLRTGQSDNKMYQAIAAEIKNNKNINYKLDDLEKGYVQLTSNRVYLNEMIENIQKRIDNGEFNSDEISTFESFLDNKRWGAAARKTIREDTDGISDVADSYYDSVYLKHKLESDKNYTDMTEYENLLEQRQNAFNKLKEAQTTEEKNSIKEEIEKLETNIAEKGETNNVFNMNGIKQFYNEKYGITDEQKQLLMDGFDLSDLGVDEMFTDVLKTNIDYLKSDLGKLKDAKKNGAGKSEIKDIEDSISAHTQQVQSMYNEILSQNSGNKDVIDRLNQAMSNSGIDIFTTKVRGLKDELTTLQYDSDDIFAEPTGEELNVSVDEAIEKVKQAARDAGIDIKDSFFDKIKKEFNDSGKSGGEFFDFLSERLKQLGFDIDNLENNGMGKSVSNDNKFLGTQDDFVSQADNVDELYSDAADIKDGKSLDNQRIVDLRNEYASLNEYIAQTGDLTFKNGQMLVDIANTTYDDGTKAIETQIDALEDYQDAILNTVDAMGMMAEFEADLEDIEKGLSDTVTDEAVAQAKAKNKFVDVAESTADGIYDANESIQTVEGKTYSLLEANAKGLIDLSDEETQAKVKAAEDSVKALYNEAAVSEEAYTLSADYIEQNRQALLDKGWTEEQITNAKTTLAGIQIDADGNIATAAGENANATQTAEMATAQAFVAVANAAVQTAISIAALFGVQSDALTKAQSDLATAQTAIDNANANKEEQTKQLAKAYAENQKRQQELNARKNQISGARGLGNKSYGSAGKKSGGGGGKSDAEKAKEEAEKLKEKIDDFREDEGTELEDVTEELIRQYETEERKLKLKRKNLDYANDLLDSEEETTKWLKVQEKLLTNQRKQIQSIYRQNSKLNQQYNKIKKENKKYNIDSWFDEDGEATLAYKNLLNSFATEEKNYRKTVSLNSEEDIENAKKHIEQIKKQRDYVENLFDSAQKLKQAWIDNNEEIQDLFVEMNDNLKEMRDTLLDKFMNQLEREVEETNQAYQDNIDKLDALITVQERYNDVINNSLDTQADLQKELQSNKDSYQYLDDYMRSIIFNEDDYKELSKELDNVMSQANELAEEYQTKINSLTEDEMYKIEEITNEYERQVDELEKQYELRKAELDVIKAKTKLENAKNERTVRMFVNGAWQWVADPEAIKSATEEVADAEKEKDRIDREQQQLQETNKMEAEKDENQLKIDLNEQLLEKVQQSVEDLTTETKSVEEWLKLIATDGVPMLHDIMAGLDKVGDIGNLLASIGSDSELIKGASKNTTAAIKRGLLNGTLDPEQWAEKIGWIKGDNGKWYAPKDDPYYNPAGFDFGKATPETQTTTDESGVQVQNGASQNKNNGGKSAPASKFPKQASLKDVSTHLNIRSGAGMGSSVIGKIPPNGKPTVIGEKGDWAQVKYNNLTGWASKQYLTYDRGGIMAGKGYALKDILQPEAVLSPEQTKAWVKLVENLTDPSLARLTATPKAESTFNGKNSSEQIVRDEYIFQNVTVQADNFEEFIASIQGYIPINNN